MKVIEHQVFRNEITQYRENIHLVNSCEDCNMNPPKN